MFLGFSSDHLGLAVINRGMIYHTVLLIFTLIFL